MLGASPPRKSLTYPAHCQNHFRNQIDGAARVRVEHLVHWLAGQDIDDRWEGLNWGWMVRPHCPKAIALMEGPRLGRGHTRKLLIVVFVKESETLGRQTASSTPTHPEPCWN